MKKLKERLWGLLWIIFVLTFISGTITLAFHLTNYLYEISNWHPTTLITQISNSLLGLFFASIFIGVIGNFARARVAGYRREIYSPPLLMRWSKLPKAISASA
jgi:hypothetical protein